MRHQDLLQDIDSLPLCLQRVLSASHLCRSGWPLSVLALLSRAVKAIQHFVQSRKSHPFLPLGGGGPALQLGQQSDGEVVLHLLPWPGIPIQWTTHKTLCEGPGSAFLRLILPWGRGGCRYSRSRWHSPNIRLTWALIDMVFNSPRIYWALTVQA